MIFKTFLRWTGLLSVSLKPKGAWWTVGTVPGSLVRHARGSGGGGVVWCGTRVMGTVTSWASTGTVTTSRVLLCLSLYHHWAYTGPTRGLHWIHGPTRAFSVSDSHSRCQTVVSRKSWIFPDFHQKCQKFINISRFSSKCQEFHQNWPFLDTVFWPI